VRRVAVAVLGAGMLAGCASPGPLTLAAAVGVQAAPQPLPVGPAPGCGATGGTVNPTAGLSPVQLGNAAVVITVGRSLAVPDRGILVALAAARQESGFIASLTEAQSDRDSAGLFQQRRAWAPNGSEAYRMDPTNAATMFYTGGHGGQRGLLDIPGWQSMSIAEAAQAVQVSAKPDAYALWEPLAVALLAAYSGGPQPCPSPDTSGWSLPLPRDALSSYNVAKPHHDYPGADLPAPIGTPVFAVQGGTVVKAGPVGGYGNHYVEVQSTTASGACVLWWYGHQSAHAVTEGQQVPAGTRMGDVGNEGFSTGPHLHLGLRPCGTGLDRGAYQCPQYVLVPIWNGTPVPDPGGAPRTGCIGPPL